MHIQIAAVFQGDDPSVVANLANPAVLSAAAKFRRLASVKKPEEGTTPTRYSSWLVD